MLVHASTDVSVAVNAAVLELSYTLECAVYGIDRLTNVNVAYEWTRGNSSVVLGGDMIYTFTPTAGDDGVMYHCEVTVTSSSLSTPITSSGSRTIRVLGICM